MNPARLLVLLVSLPLLLGGCGVEEPEAEVKPELLPLDEEELARVVRSVNTNELEEREGLTYLKGSETPYTGKGFDLYENWRSFEYLYKEGKRINIKVFNEEGRMISNIFMD